MKQNILNVVFLMCVSLSSLAQITFQKTFGGTDEDKGYYVKQTSDGGYILCGSTRSYGASGQDFYFIKTNANGDTLWTKTFGGVFHEECFSFQQTSDSGYVLIGSTSSFGVSSAEIYIMKTDVNGNLLWSKTYGGVADDDAYSIQQTTDGGYIIAGYTSNFGMGDDVYLIKTDLNGDSLWTKTFSDGLSYYHYNVLQTTDGGYIIAGSTDYSGNGSVDIYLIKTDSNGNLLWSKTYGAAGTAELGSFIKPTSDGGYIIIGTTGMGAGIYDVYVVKIDSSGNLSWSKTYGGAFDDEGYSGQQTSDGGYIIAGLSGSFSVSSTKIYLIKTDINGNLLWSNYFGATSVNFGWSVSQTSDGGYIINGWTSGFGAGGRDVYLIKTDSIGNTGCNQGSASTLVSSPTIQVTNHIPTVSSGGTVLTAATLVGHGCIVNSPCPVGIDEVFSDNLLQITPNPSGGNFTITFDKIINSGEIEIFNIYGVKIFHENINQDSNKGINLKNIPKGIYFLKVSDGQKCNTKKIMILQNLNSN